MISPFCVSLVLLVGGSSFEEANTALFEQWAQSLQTPEITIGIPSKDVAEESRLLFDDIYEQLVLSTSDNLTEVQRELNLPFALGMIEGVRAACGDKNAATACLNHLSELDDAVSGWAASRLWRMRLHAYECLENSKERQASVQHILKIKNADIEDQLVAVLRNENPVNFAAWDSKLATLGRNDLRWPFACGVVKLKPVDHLEFIFTLADDLVTLGIDRNTIDVKLGATVQLLNPSLEIATNSQYKFVSSLASRLAAGHALQSKEYASAQEKYLTLMHQGCAYSAGVLLTTPEFSLQENEIGLSLEAVLAHPEESPFELSYWQLFAGSHAANKGNKNAATTQLNQITQESKYYADAQNIIQIILDSDVDSLKDRIDRAAKSEGNLQIVMKDVQSETTADQLLQHYVKVWHGRGLSQRPWLSEVVRLLLEKTNDTSLSLQGEANRLLGQMEAARRLFEQSIREQGKSLQVVVGLADCNRDLVAMNKTMRSLDSRSDQKYWFWLANARSLQWYCEDGGDKTRAQAKVNRLKQLDPSLGGEQFAEVFQEALR